MGLDHNAGYVFHFFDPALLAGYGNDIQNAVDEPGLPFCQIINKVQFNAIKQRLAPEIGIMGSQNQLLPGDMIFELKRPGPHRMPVKALRPHFLHSPLADYEPPGIIGKFREKQRGGQGLLQNDLNGIGALGMERHIGIFTGIGTKPFVS